RPPGTYVDLRRRRELRTARVPAGIVVRRNVVVAHPRARLRGRGGGRRGARPSAVRPWTRAVALSATLLDPMAEVVSTNQFRNGMHIELDGQTWRIVEFQHVKQGKGGGFRRPPPEAPRSGLGVAKTLPRRWKVNPIRT